MVLTGAPVEQVVPGVVLVEQFLFLKVTSSKCSLVVQVETVQIVHRTPVVERVAEASLQGWRVAQAAQRAT